MLREGGFFRGVFGYALCFHLICPPPSLLLSQQVPYRKLIFQSTTTRLTLTATSTMTRFTTTSMFSSPSTKYLHALDVFVVFPPHSIHKNLRNRYYVRDTHRNCVEAPIRMVNTALVNTVESLPNPYANPPTSSPGNKVIFYQVPIFHGLRGRWECVKCEVCSSLSMTFIFIGGRIQPS